MPYIWAIVILVLIGAVFILSILWLRPQSDPLVIISTVVGIVGLILGQVIVFMKTTETHDTVNSRDTEWKSDFAELMRAQGKLQGMIDEQSRVAEQKRILAMTESATPVEIVNVAPVPVTETKK